MRKNGESKAAKDEAAKRPVRSKAPAKSQAAKPKAKMGRPSIYTQDLADRICAQLSAGLSMRTVCKADDMPDMVTVFRWLRTKEEFCKQYEKAKAEAADALVEEMLDIADDGTNDWMEIHDKDGECAGYKVNGEHVQRSRLRVDTRKWIAAKLKPKKYGERVDVDHGIQKDNSITELFTQLAGKTLKPGGGE